MKTRAEGGFERTADEFAVLFQLAVATIRVQHLDEVAGTAFDVARHLLGCHRAAVLVAEADGTLRCRAHRLLSDPCIAAIEASGPEATRTAGREPLLIDDLRCRADVPAVAALRAEGVIALGVVPLFHVDELVGEFLMCGDQPRPFGPHGVALAGAIGAVMGAALLRARALEAMLRDHAAAEMAARTSMEVLAGVAHDLRSPLGAVLLTAESMLGAGTVLAPELRPRVRRIRLALERMNRMIDDLLDLTAIRAGRLSLHRQRWPVEDVIDLAFAVSATAAQQHGVTLQTRVPGGLPALYCDRERLVRVLVNLITNAIKVTPPGDMVMVQASQRVGMAELSVIDTGTGMEEAEIVHVFERYWRSPSADHSGFGLGLHIARVLVEAHGGSIRVDSAPGRGSRFTIAIPIDLP